MTKPTRQMRRVQRHQDKVISLHNAFLVNVQNMHFHGHRNEPEKASMYWERVKSQMAQLKRLKEKRLL